MKSDFLLAVTQLAAERGLPKESVVAAVEAALVSAYKKDSQAAGHDITVRLDPNNGEIRVYAQKTVKEQVTDTRRELTQAEAKKHKPGAALGDVLEIEVSFPVAGRIAAQTAKQVVVQRLRQAERELVLAEYSQRVGELLAGRVERVEPQRVVVNLGKAEGILPKEEQVPSERYRPNQTMQFYLLQVATTERGPELILSRSDRGLLRRLFEREVPEIFNGIVEIQAIARETGARSKVAVSARQEGVDPVGSCVGLRGFRIQNIVNELQGENIDVVQWHPNQGVFIGNALSPAQVLRVDMDEVNKAARVVIPDRQLSLAIGREGQNVRLAAKLTGWKLDLKGLSEYEAELAGKAATAAAPELVAVAVQTAAPAPVARAPVAVPQAAPAEAREKAAKPEVEKARAPVAPALSPEEELLLAGGLGEAPGEVAETPPEEAVEVAPDDARIWQVPVARGPSVLRFAEDLMPERARRREGRGGRDDERRTKGKKVRPARATPAGEGEPGAEPGAEPVEG